MLLLQHARIECTRASQLLQQVVYELKQPLLVLPTCHWAIISGDKTFMKCKSTNATA